MFLIDEAMFRVFPLVLVKMRVMMDVVWIVVDVFIDELGKVEFDWVGL